jgi:chromate reductase
VAIRVLGLCGSLRRGSYNRALLRAAIALAPDGLAIETAEIGDLPHYNADLDRQAAGSPELVVQFKQRIRDADGVLIVSPEYNYSIPGCLKNAIDWVSRQPDPPFSGKPVAVMGASTGAFGTVRMQLHLRQVAVYTNMLLMNGPEVLVAKGPEKFNDAGELIDEPTRKSVAAQLVAFKAWIERLRGPR